MLLQPLVEGDLLTKINEASDISTTFPKLRYYYNQFYGINPNEKYSLSLSYKYKEDTDYIYSYLYHIARAYKGLSMITNSTYKTRYDKFFKLESDQTTPIIQNSFFTHRTPINPLLQPRAVNVNGKIICFDAETLKLLNIYKNEVENEKRYESLGNQSNGVWGAIMDPTITIDTGLDNSEFVTIHNIKYMREDVYTDILLNELSTQWSNLPIDDWDVGPSFYSFMMSVVNYKTQSDLPSISKQDFDYFISYVDYYGPESLKNRHIDGVNDELVSVYLTNYNHIMVDFYSLINQILTPQTKYQIFSPSLSIVMIAMTIMAIKKLIASSKTNEYHNKLFIELFTKFYHLSTAKKIEYHIESLYEFLFSKEILSIIEEDLEKVLPILSTITKPSSLQNDTELDDDLNHTKQKFINILSSIDNSTIANTIILLMELCGKIDHIRWFDSAIFNIDNSLITNENKNSVKMFADSLQEASFIILNSLGASEFVNSHAPDTILSYNPKLDSLDHTRFINWNEKFIRIDNEANTNKFTYDRVNPFNSSIAAVNIFSSIAYCIDITLSNLFVNNTNIKGPLYNSAIKRPYSMVRILSEYARHLYMATKGCGIFNDMCIVSSENIKNSVVHRSRWLLYGLHFKTWIDNAYHFYTNYKHLMNQYNDPDKTTSLIFGEMNDYKSPLFKEELKNHIPIYNIGFTLYPTLGSRGLTTIAACLSQFFVRSSKYIKSIIQHSLKDVIVGDAMLTFLSNDDRRWLMNINDSGRLTSNSTSRLYQKAINRLSKDIYEDVLGTTSIQWIKRVLKPTIKNNISILRQLNIDENFLNIEPNSEDSYITFNNLFCERLIKEMLIPNGQMPQDWIDIIVDLYNMGIYANITYTDYIQTNFIKFRGFGISSMPTIARHPIGAQKLFTNESHYGGFLSIIEDELINPQTYSYGKENHLSTVLSLLDNNYQHEDAFLKCRGLPLYCYSDNPYMIYLNNYLDGIGVAIATDTDIILAYLYMEMILTLGLDYYLSQIEDNGNDPINRNSQLLAQTDIASETLLSIKENIISFIKMLYNSYHRTVINESRIPVIANKGSNICQTISYRSSFMNYDRYIRLILSTCYYNVDENKYYRYCYENTKGCRFFDITIANLRSEFSDELIDSILNSTIKIGDNREDVSLIDNVKEMLSSEDKESYLKITPLADGYEVGLRTLPRWYIRTYSNFSNLKSLSDIGRTSQLELLMMSKFMAHSGNRMINEFLVDNYEIVT